MRFRKKPVVVEAYQTNVPLEIETLEGIIHASPGDWIITGVNGEKYPCKPDIFEKTYEPVNDSEERQKLLMKQSEAYDLLCKEYLSKCRESGCDGCIAEFYCIENHLRKDRYPQNDCHEKLKKYFQSK